MSVGVDPRRPRVGWARQKREPGGPSPSGGLDGREPARRGCVEARSCIRPA